MRLTRRSFLKLGGVTLLALSFPLKGMARSATVPVILYHDISAQFKDDYTVTPAEFAAQMEWLFNSGYRAVPLRDLQNLRPGEEERLVVITFDDGYASFGDYAFPLLREYGFTSTINIIGRNVGSYLHFAGNRPMLSWDEYRLLGQTGLVDFGCHAFNLHALETLRNASLSDVEKDLRLFLDAFRREMGATTDILAWPYGYFTEERNAIARQLGFRYILTSREATYVLNSSDEVSRLNINGKFDLISFKQYLEGVW